MGCADVVPGVSGGTMALLMGIYEELIDAIRACGQVETWNMVLHGQWSRAWQKVHGPFLVTVFLGIVTAVFSLAHLIEWLLEAYPLRLWGFFFGLVLASVLEVSRRIKKWDITLVVGLVAGAAIAYCIVGLVPLQTPEASWFVFLSGAIAICAMILPGISGSFLLVLMGKYTFILQAVSDRNFAVLGIFFVGAAVGLLAFAQLLSRLLHRYHDATIAVLTGLMLGSLRKVWPWKQLTTGGELNVLPGAIDREVTLVLCCMVVGFAVVLALDYIARKENN